MLEIIKYLARLENVTLEEVIAIAQEKGTKRGTFENKIFLEKVLRSNKLKLLNFITKVVLLFPLEHHCSIKQTFHLFFSIFRKGSILFFFDTFLFNFCI